MQHVQENIPAMNEQVEIDQSVENEVEQRKVRKSYYFIGASLVLISTIFLMASMNMESHSRTKEIITAATFPIALSIIMLILGFVLIIQTAMKKYDQQVEKHHAESHEEGEHQQLVEEDTWKLRWAKSPVVFMIASVVYLLLISQLGFFVTTAIYLAFALYLIGIISWLNRIILAASLMLFAYFVFVDLLLIRLPVGPWGF